MRGEVPPGKWRQAAAGRGERRAGAAARALGALPCCPPGPAPAFRARPPRARPPRAFPLRPPVSRNRGGVRASPAPPSAQRAPSRDLRALRRRRASAGALGPGAARLVLSPTHRAAAFTVLYVACQAFCCVTDFFSSWLIICTLAPRQSVWRVSSLQTIFPELVFAVS